MPPRKKQKQEPPYDVFNDNKVSRIQQRRDCEDSMDEEGPQFPEPNLKTPRKSRTGNIGGRKPKQHKPQRVAAPPLAPPQLPEALNFTPQLMKRSRSPVSPNQISISPPHKKLKQFSPNTSRTIRFSMKPLLQLPSTISNASQGLSSLPGPGIKHLHDGPNPVNHEGWWQMGQYPTPMLPGFFHLLHNDFTPNLYSAHSSIKIIFTGHPVDRKQDIQCREAMLVWNTVDGKPPPQFQGEEGSKLPVYRVIYLCTGNCDDPPEPQVRHNHKQASTLRGNKPGKLSKSQCSKGRNRRKCANGVKLHVEVYANDLSTAWVWQSANHNPAPDWSLQMSQYLRQIILMYSSIANMTAGKIKRQLIHDYERFKIPIYRRPDDSTIANMVNNVRKKDRLISDPLLAIGIFAKNNPEKIFSYIYNADQASVQFQVGIKNDYCVQNLLLYGRTNGLGLDSSYRNKNENRAPVTFIVTVDKNQRMLPGPVFLSGDVKERTLVEFLRKVREFVEYTAQAILDDPSLIHAAHSSEHKKILQEAQAILDEKGWFPLFVMIDKSNAERNAILAVWPNMVVRLCQFHVIQAILRWQTDSGTPAEGRPKLNRTKKYLLLWSFRKLQRAKDEASWQEQRQIFTERLRIVVPASTFETILGYFEENWFVERWRDLWTDIGLPSGHNRDYISTNNFTERAFKLFDEIFLENRANKSAYRLVLILANEWFDYFAQWQPKNSRRKDNAYYQMVLEGHQLWNSGQAIIEDERDQQGRRVFKVLAEV